MKTRPSLGSALASITSLSPLAPFPQHRDSVESRAGLHADLTPERPPGWAVILPNPHGNSENGGLQLPRLPPRVQRVRGRTAPVRAPAGTDAAPFDARSTGQGNR